MQAECEVESPLCQGEEQKLLRDIVFLPRDVRFHPLSCLRASVGVGVRERWREAIHLLMGGITRAHSGPENTFDFSAVDNDRLGLSRLFVAYLCLLQIQMPAKYQ